MKQRFCSGSVSIFYVLILVGLISVLFAFLEAARVSALKTNVHLLTGQAEDAVYASYQPEFWALASRRVSVTCSNFSTGWLGLP